MGTVSVFGYKYFKNQSSEQGQNQFQIKKIWDSPMISPIPAFDNSAMWYFDENAALYRINLDGSKFSEFPLPEYNREFIKALWPKSGSDFLVMGNSPDTQSPIPYKTFYNSASNIYIELPVNIYSIDWMPDSRRVIYIWKANDNKTQSLAMADADGSGFRNIASVFWDDLIVKASPDGKQALLYRSKIEGDTNKVYLVDIETGQITTGVENGKILEAMWVSPTKIIYAKSNNTVYPSLYMLDTSNKTSTDLKLNTGINKIVLDKESKYIYAAVPKPDNSGDVFVKIDLNTSMQENYFTPKDQVRGINLMLLGNSLYYIDARDNKLYAVAK